MSENQEFLQLFLVMAPSNLIASIGAWQEAQILRREKLKSYYAMTSVVEVVSGAVAIGMFLLGFGMVALVAQIYARALFIALGYLLISRPVLSRGLSLVRSYEVFRWSLPQYWTMGIAQATIFAPDIIIGALLSPSATGFFRAASRITSAISDVCAQPLRVIAMTVFSRHASMGGSATSAFVNLIGLSLFIGSAALGLLALNITLALHLVFGMKWAGIEGIVVVLCVGRLFSIVGGVCNPFLVAYGKQRTLVPIQLSISASLILGLVVFSSSGLLAIGIVTSASMAIGGLLYLAASMVVAKVDIPSMASSTVSALAPLVVSSVSAFAITTCEPNILSTVPGSVTVCGVSLIVFLLVAVTQRRRIVPMFRATIGVSTR
jgi:O-antigen/teichoic acid export membrane protein